MALVNWIGRPDHWMPPKTSFEEAKWVLAATDDALPVVAQLVAKRHIKPLAALKAVDRYELRRALVSCYNPAWSSFEYCRRVVVKAPASAASSGVRLLDIQTPEIEIVNVLRRLNGNPPQLWGVVEEFIEGDAIELSGVKLSGALYFFHMLRQRWSPDWSRIERYERVFDRWWLYNETVVVLNDIGLDNSAFCVEWRVIRNQQAKVIEINPRPGDDDKGYFEALWDRPIAEQIEEWAEEVFRAESSETAQVQVVVAQG